VVHLVADTHAIVWLLAAPRKLGRQAARAFRAVDAGRSLCLIPAIALVEVALLRERGRVKLGPADLLRALRGRLGYAVLAMDGDQAVEFGTLVGVKDPMDRMVLAAARVARARLISGDPGFDGFEVERVWD
jgi:PIN domain nuclease of toxin-antitoxin system